MPRYAADSVLLAPLPDVWTFLADPYNLADWWPGISGVEPDRRGLAPGARWKVLGPDQPTYFRKPQMTGTLLVLDVVPMQRVAFQLTGDRIEAELTLRPAEDDRTEASLVVGFVDVNFLRNASHSAGAIWDTVLRKERKGDFLGATVQVIPHVTNEIKARIRRAAEAAPVDVVISEIGGTVGDIESLPFLEAIRQFRREVGQENVVYVHVTLVPFIEAAGALKTKPTQHSVNEPRRIGTHPDVVVCRSHEELSRDIRDKIALFADVDPGADVASPDVPDVYLVPQVLQAEGLDRLVCEKLGLDAREAELGEWGELTKRIDERRELVEIALVGKYVKLQDAYLSVHEALKHAGLHNGCAVRVRWVDAEHT